MYPIISLFGQQIQTYYICAAAAGIAGILLAIYCLREVLPLPHRVILPLITALIAVIGARAFNVLINPDAYRTFSPFTLAYTKLSLPGGLMLGTAMIVVYVLAVRKSVGKVFDAFVIPCGAGIVLLKLGCFLNGCCFGKPTDSFPGMVFPANESAYRFLRSLPLIDVSGERVHPTQLYEMLGAALSVALAVFLAKRLRLRDGSSGLLFAFCFTMVRFAVLPLRALPYRSGIITVFYPCLYGGTLLFCGVCIFLLNTYKRTGG